jgi:hypothetical protein
VSFPRRRLPPRSARRRPRCRPGRARESALLDQAHLRSRGNTPRRAKVDAMTTDAIGAVVRRLSRPHASGGMVIERSAILAEGADSAAILTWISDHDGVADSTVATSRSTGLHGMRESTGAGQQASPARRFVLPARVFD